METLKIDRTEDSPQVIFDKEKGLFEISGKSLPEDVSTFYEPILSWLEEYSKNPASKTTFNFRLTYFNTASSKVILDILTMFEKMIGEGYELLVRWFYSKEDEDMLEAGEEYAEMVEVPFEMVSY
jgi:hypothetical protein